MALTKTIVAYSDCLDVNSEHDETILERYSNATDYAGLVYEDLEEVVYFYIRVHGQFFRERFPETDESEMFSDNSVASLSSEVRKQKHLLIEPAPYYFHELQKLVLKHNLVELDGVTYVKQEEYEMEDLDKYNPLATGACWLTKKVDGFLTNVYGEV